MLQNNFFHNNKLIYMDSDNENEGFQHQEQHSFDLIELVEEPTISQTLVSSQKIPNQPNQMQPPISTYVQMKNCPTPSCLNNIYSYEKENNKKMDAQITDKPKVRTNHAWCCDEQKYLSEQFNEEDYKLIYSKFTQKRSNYRFFRQYARSQYKIFVDEDNIEYSDEQSEEISPQGQASKLDFVKIQKIMSGSSEVKQLRFRSNFEGGNLQKVYIKQKEADPHQQYNFKMLKKTSSTLNDSLGGSIKRNSIQISKYNESRIIPKVIKQNGINKTQKKYFLMLSNDTNTIGFNQWFYFKVYNPNYQRQINATFIIFNINKKTIENIDSIGIQTFSLSKYKYENEGWNKSFNGISFNNKNNLMKDPTNFYHTLQFQATIKSRDTVYFALAIPYTYTKLQKFIENHAKNFQLIGTTFCGNPLHIYKTGSSKATKSIVITARQHPSETSSSFVVQGIINKLSSSSLLINLLKKRYQIYVIPMTNPDGVIHGNSRTNLLGFDINRKWQTLPNKRHSYEVFNLIHELFKKIPKIQYLIDLHGHSKKLNSFAYFTTKKSLASIIGLEMAQKLPWFSLADCQMATNAPPNTLRWYAASNFAVQKAITIQTSIHGWRDKDRSIKPFTPESLELIGSTLIEIISKLELQKKINLKTIRNVIFTECHESSDSDPEGDYLRQINIISSKQDSPRKQKEKMNESISHKLRIKTFSTNFYKPTLNSSIRQKIKTQYQEFNVQKVNIELTTPPQRRGSRKKTLDSRFYRCKEKYISSIRKLSVRYNDVNQSLTCKQIEQSREGSAMKNNGNSNKILSNMGKILKKKLKEVDEDRGVSQKFIQKIEQSNLRLSHELQSRYNQKINYYKVKNRQMH